MDLHLRLVLTFEQRLKWHRNLFRIHAGIDAGRSVRYQQE